jgi:predicted transcriptional regulator
MIIRTIKKTLHIILIIWGVLALAVQFNTLGEKGFTSNIAFNFILLGLVPIGLGVWLLMRAKNTKEQLNDQVLTNKILKIAQENNGILTPLTLITALNLSVEDAKERLEDLYSKGIFKIEVNEEGGVYYELSKAL